MPELLRSSKRGEETRSKRANKKKFLTTWQNRNLPQHGKERSSGPFVPRPNFTSGRSFTAITAPESPIPHRELNRAAEIPKKTPDHRNREREFGHSLGSWNSARPRPGGRRETAGAEPEPPCVAVAALDWEEQLGLNGESTTPLGLPTLPLGLPTLPSLPLSVSPRLLNSLRERDCESSQPIGSTTWRSLPGGSRATPDPPSPPPPTLPAPATRSSRLRLDLGAGRPAGPRVGGGGPSCRKMLGTVGTGRWLRPANLR